MRLEIRGETELIIASENDFESDALEEFCQADGKYIITFVFKDKEYKGLVDREN